MLVRGTLWFVALPAFGNLALTVLQRIAFPYPLEWMEGASLVHALRLFAGDPLYVAPSGEFIPYLYPPLGYVPLGLTSVLFGATLPIARLGAVVCLLVTLLCIGRAGQRLGGSMLSGLIASATFALGFGYTGAFLDLVRVDGCFVMLLAAGTERTIAGRYRTALWLFACSALAKQHGALVLGALAVALLWLDARRHFPSIATVTLGLCAAFLALQFASSGQFARYVLELPMSHGLRPQLLFSFLLVDLGVYLPMLVLSMLLAARRGALTPPMLALVGAAIAASALGRAHPGGDDNVRLPAFLLLCITGAALLVPPILDRARSAASRVTWLVVLLVQLGVLMQPPGAHAPTKKTSAQFAALQRALILCAEGGSTAALDYTRLGNRELPHTMALSDLRMGSAHALAAQGTSALLAWLGGTSAPDALAVGEHFQALDAVLARNYVLCERLPAPRLPTGYSPGNRSGGGLEQLVYRRRVP
jgi:hypothetical protein